VKRVEVFVEQQEAVVELESAAEAGKLLLRTEPVIFNDTTLRLAEEGRDGATTRATAGMFPRKAASRPRAGLGHQRQPAPKANTTWNRLSSVSSAHPSDSQGLGKGQDDFREMLGGR